jgi:hypothetical protein
MQENGQVYADLTAFVPEADRKRLAEAEKDEKLLLDRASMREAITAQREERGLPPVRGAEEEIVPEA